MARGGKREGAGRKKGTPNQTTQEVKEAILKAFEEVGGYSYLVEIAQTNPQVFCQLLGKVLPRDIQADVNLRTVLKRIDLSGQNDSNN